MGKLWNRQSSGSRSQADSRPTATIRDFFADNDRLDVKRLRWFKGTFVLAALVTAYVIDRLWEHKPVPFVGFLTGDQTDGRLLAFTFLLGIFASVCSSLLAVYFVNKGSLSRIERVKRLAQRGVLETQFNTLEKFHGKYARNKQVTLKFESPLLNQQNKIVGARCSINVRLGLKPVKESIHLEFRRLSRPTVGTPKVPGLPNVPETVIDLLDPNRPDEVFSADVTDISSLFPGREQELFKGITEVSINSEPWVVNSTAVSGKESNPIHEQSKPGSPATNSPGIEAKQGWILSLDNEDLLDQVIDLQYKYEFSVEIPGYTSFEVSEPTEGLRFEIDYSIIVKEISCYPVPLVNSTVHTHSVKSDETGKIVTGTDRWVVPPSGIVYAWFHKDDPSLPSIVAAPQVAAVVQSAAVSSKTATT